VKQYKHHNILISSSRQWNPGDEFILMGVRRLLASVLGEHARFILWNRNPDLFLDGWREPVFRPSFLTNSAVEPALDVMDLVVLAGTPEWFGPPLERVYRELLRYPRVPLLALGVGTGQPGFLFTPTEREIFLRENSLLVCRNPTLVEEINNQLGFDKARLFPCPAFFCSPVEQPRTATAFEASRPVLTVQADSVENQSAPSELVARVERFLTQDPRADRFEFAAHYIDDFLRFARIRPGSDIFYSYEPLDYLNFFHRHTRMLVTSRLHGAIAALSCGTSAALIDFGNARVNDAAIPFLPVMELMPLDECLRTASQITTTKAAQLSNEILSFKGHAFVRYEQMIRQFLDQHYLHICEPAA
jgi:hypothetical protein